MIRQWQLNQNSVNGRIFVQDTDSFQQLGFRKAGIVFFENGADTVIVAGTFLVLHINHGSRIVAYHDNGQTRSFSCGGQFCRTFGDILADFSGQLVSVDNLGSHVV